MDTGQIQQQKQQQSNNIGYKKYGWKNVAIKVKENDLIALNRQLDRLGYETLGDLVKDLMSGKITRMTDDKQIDVMKSNLQATGQNTAQSGNYYDFYKNIDTNDLLKEYNKRYHSRTAVSLVNYFKRYADIFFGPEPDTELFKLKPHKRAWILQAMKRFGDYYFWKYNSREVQNLVKTVIERYMLNRDLDMTGLGNKKAFVTILPTKMWEQFRKITKFDRHDIVAAHSITKRDADILYMGLRKIHYNVMRFKDTMTADEADALAGRAKTVAAQHYVLHDLQLFVDKYVKAWNNIGLNIV